MHPNLSRSLDLRTAVKVKCHSVILLKVGDTLTHKYDHPISRDILPSVTFVVLESVRSDEGEGLFDGWRRAGAGNNGNFEVGKQESHLPVPEKVEKIISLKQLKTAFIQVSVQLQEFGIFGDSKENNFELPSTFLTWQTWHTIHGKKV